MKPELSLSSRLAGWATALGVIGTIATGGQKTIAQGTLGTDESFRWSVPFSQASSGGTVFYPGAVANGTITFNPSSLTPDSIEGYDATANIFYGVTYGGNTVNYSYSDLNIVYAAGVGQISLAWNQQSDSLTLDISPSSVPATPSSIQAALISAANGGYTIQDNAGALWDGNYGNWGTGPVTSFTDPVPEPGTLALAGLGALTLLALGRKGQGQDQGRVDSRFGNANVSVVNADHQRSRIRGLPALKV
jgi:hypothetical protein